MDRLQRLLGNHIRFLDELALAYLAIMICLIVTYAPYLCAGSLVEVETISAVIHG